MSCLILFPTQLFEDNYLNKIFENIKFNIKNDQDEQEQTEKTVKTVKSAKIIKKERYIILWEHDYFFKDMPYHKLKLAFHRASMKYYYENLNIQNNSKLYIESIETKKNQYESIIKFINKNNINQLLFFNPIEKKILSILSDKKLIPNLNIEYCLFPSPYFLNSSNFNKNDEIEKSMNSARHDVFYRKQRINYNIMVTKTNNKIVPDGNSWSFDTENRSPFEKSQKEVNLLNINSNHKYIDSAIDYININYKNNYGLCEKTNFIYPISREDALKWLKDFIERKLSKFGKYEDAFSSKIIFGYHSVLSPLTNIGLITPIDIIESIKKHKKDIQSKEGFIRQVIGWREYCYYIYDKYGETLEKKFFYKKLNKKIPQKFWDCKTQIPIIDNMLSNVNKYAYSHHIERLMCIGNFMLLIDIHPQEIYNWFQTMYIDAYDVFMVPNVYGMLLYGLIDDKNHMMTRPYFCSSNYLMKMSDYRTESIDIGGKNYKWNEIFDALYYRLVSNYSNEFSKIYSTANAVKRFNGFTANKKNELLDLGNFYVKWIHS
jgi:deoxyribodipyrimidine photolyase-related protein